MHDGSAMDVCCFTTRPTGLRQSEKFHVHELHSVNNRLQLSSLTYLAPSEQIFQLPILILNLVW